MEGPGNLSERADTLPPCTSVDTILSDTRITDIEDTSKCDSGVPSMYNSPKEKNVTSDQNNNNQDLADDTAARADDIRRTEGRSLRIRNRRRLVPEKIRHKRQALQDMARPLKQWLYHHRGNPYPSKSEKVALAAGSQMTLIQVSNWFANARRRLKNTVRDPDLSWSSRIKLYNTYVEGNAELFSVSSDDSIWDSEEEGGQNPTFPTDQSEVISDDHSVAMDTIVPSRAATPDCPQWYQVSCRLPVVEDSGSHIKYKHTILQRYLNDHYQHPVSLDEQDLPRTRDRRQSGSMGSRDYEEMSTSSASSPFNDIQHNVYEDFPDDGETHTRRRRAAEDDRGDQELYWKTLDAAVALANLARANQKI